MPRWVDLSAFDFMTETPRSMRYLFVLSVGLLVLSFAWGIAQSIRQSKALPGLSSNPVLFARELAHRGDLVAAAEELEAFEAIVPRENDSILDLAQTLSQLGRREEALAAYRRAVTSTPANVKAHFLLGAELFLRRDFTAASASFETALKLNPRYPGALENLAVSYLNDGRVADAIERYEQVIEWGTASAGTHDTLSRAYEMVGDRERAYEHAKMAFEMDTKNPGIGARFRLLSKGRTPAGGAP